MNPRHTFPYADRKSVNAPIAYGKVRIGTIREPLALWAAAMSMASILQMFAH